MPDIQQLREQAAERKVAAQGKVAGARAEAERRKLLRDNPVPQYVEMPEQTGDAEEDSEKDLGALEFGFRKRMADEGRRFALATDSEYWSAICFNTREQKEAFFAALGVLDLGNGARYFDGNAIAQRMGINLPAGDPPARAGRKPDPTWVEFVKD